MAVTGRRALRRVVLEGLGWVLVLVGIAALVLPGPGLLAIFAGLLLLSQQYEWAARYVEPVRLKALRGAAESVATWPRITASCLGGLALIGFGVLWIIDPATPSWWPFRESWWLPGGIWTGVTQVGSGLFALGMIGYSYRRFRNNPEELAELDADIDTAEAAAD